MAFPFSWMVLGLVILISYKVIQFISQKNVWKHGRKRYEGKVVLITGATSGLGESKLLFVCFRIHLIQIFFHRID